MQKIPLSIAILISINIVVGGGFFISASNIFKATGLLAPLTWIICGLLLLPLVKVLAHLSSLYPSAGGIYVYSKEQLGNFWGFVSGWGYFIGTIAGNAIILHEFSSLAKDLGFTLPFTHTLSPGVSAFIFDAFFVIFFTIVNLLNITVLEKMNILFTLLKVIPIGLVIVSMFFFFDPSNLYTAPIKSFGLIQTMPIVLFAFIGIEACCAISHTIKNGQRNAAKAMLIAFGIIIALYSLTQLGLLGILGVNTTNPFFEIIPHLTKNITLIYWGNLIIKLAILSSFLGGFYGMFYANAWNLYALAKEETIPFSKQLSKLNKYNTPWGAVLNQGALIILLLVITQKSPTSLMIMSGFGVVIAYILSSISYISVEKNKFSKYFFGTTALLGSGALFILCSRSLLLDGMLYVIPFIAILLIGIIFYKAKNKKINLFW